MFNEKGRKGAALAPMLIASFALACSALKEVGTNSVDEANKLVKSAKDDLREVDRISDDSDDNVSALNRAENDKNADEVKRVLGELINSIDKGIERGESAADKIEKASKLSGLNDKYKEYLSLKAQAFRKQIDAFKSLREAAVIERDNFGRGGEEEDKAKKDFHEKYDNYKKLIAEAKKIHRQADDIARENPDMIKTS